MFCLFDELLADVDSFLDRLAANAGRAGYKLYLVGGSVRDAIMGRPTRDVDLATDARFRYQDYLRHRNLMRLALGEKFGTKGIVGDVTVEIIPSGPRRGSRGDVRAALHTDLRTATSRSTPWPATAHGRIARSVRRAADIKQHLVRAVEDPEERFREDPVRLLRAVRLAAELGFYLDRPTAEAIRRLAPLLDEVARERVGDEMDKLLMSDRPSEGISLLDSLGLLEYTVPEMLEMHEMERGPHHYKQVYPIPEGAGPHRAGLGVRWAALLHDVARATHDLGQREREVHFFGHERLGARMTRDILTRLRRRRGGGACGQLVAEHLRIGVYEGRGRRGGAPLHPGDRAYHRAAIRAVSRRITSQRANGCPPRWLV